jgi:hypothetical protein
VLHTRHGIPRVDNRGSMSGEFIEIERCMVAQ